MNDHNSRTIFVENVDRRLKELADKISRSPAKMYEELNANEERAYGIQIARDTLYEMLRETSGDRASDTSDSKSLSLEEACQRLEKVYQRAEENGQRLRLEETCRIERDRIEREEKRRKKRTYRIIQVVISLSTIGLTIGAYKLNIRPAHIFTTLFAIVATLILADLLRADPVK